MWLTHVTILYIPATLKLCWFNLSPGCGQTFTTRLVPLDVFVKSNLNYPGLFWMYCCNSYTSCQESKKEFFSFSTPCSTLILIRVCNWSHFLLSCSEEKYSSFQCFKNSWEAFYTIQNCLSQFIGISLTLVSSVDTNASIIHSGHPTMNK